MNLKIIPRPIKLGWENFKNNNREGINFLSFYFLTNERDVKTNYEITRIY